MASLSFQRWHAFVPDIGNNRELPAGQQLVLEVEGGLTKEQIIAHLRQLQGTPLERKPDEATQKADEEARIAALCERVRLLGTHTIGGKSVTTMREYIDAVRPINDGYNIRELLSAVAYFNSLQAGDALFSERRSGGTAFTPPRSAAQD